MGILTNRELELIIDFCNWMEVAPDVPVERQAEYCEIRDKLLDVLANK